MKTIDYLTGPSAEIWWPAIIAGIAIALLGGVLSVPVVLKKLAFIGQGISHAAFGGVGVALVLGLFGTTAGATLGYLGVVSLFCIATAVGIAWVSSRSKGHSAEDTVIGVFLVASMALGALLTNWHRTHSPTGGRAPNVEQLLFGSILDVGWWDAGLAWGVLLITLTILLLWRRPLLFWLFDEPAARAFGVRTSAMQMLLLVLLGVATVTAMKLAGAVLATALLVLPGAAALRVSSRLGIVIALAMVAGVVGVLGGLILSFELDWPPGACVVAVLVGLFVVASATRITRRA